MQSRDLSSDLLPLFSRAISPWVFEATTLIDPREPIEPVDAAHVLEPLTWLLQSIGTSGVSLTAAGYLPTAIVRQAHATGLFDDFTASSREGDRPKLFHLRQTLQRLRLLRLSKGRVNVTKRGAQLLTDPDRLWWFVCDGLPLDTHQFDRECAMLEMLDDLLTESEQPDPEPAPWTTRTRVSDALSIRWRTPDGRPVRPGYTMTMALLRVLGVSQRRGPSAKQARVSQSAKLALLRGALTQPALAPRPVSDVEGACLELKITLVGVEPQVWRRIRVPSRIPLDKLHLVVQGAMGWADAHLHQFVASNGTSYSTFLPDWEDDDEDETSVQVWQVLQPGQELTYLYDFGDNWEHTIEIVSAGDHPLEPVCLDGSGACPPENIGGVHGYADFLAAVPTFDPHRHDSEWATHRMATALHGPEQRWLQIALRPD